MEHAKAKAKQHTVYKNNNDVRVPGVTTILGVLNKPALVRWANKLGLEGIDSSKYVDELADIGTLAHKMVEDYLKGVETDYSDYSPNQKDKAENSFLKFLEWEKKNEFKVIDSELQVVSELYQFGGTCDIYCMLNGKKTLLDIKTSKGCWPEHHLQAVAYAMLLSGIGQDVEEIKILRIGRTEEEGFEEITVGKHELNWRKFKACLKIYNIDKELRKRS